MTLICYKALWEVIKIFIQGTKTGHNQLLFVVMIQVFCEENGMLEDKHEKWGRG